MQRMGLMVEIIKEIIREEQKVEKIVNADDNPEEIGQVIKEFEEKRNHLIKEITLLTTDNAPEHSRFYRQTYSEIYQRFVPCHGNLNRTIIQ